MVAILSGILMTDCRVFRRINVWGKNRNIAWKH